MRTRHDWRRDLHKEFRYKVETTTPSTNMVYFRWTSQSIPVERLITECEQRGVRFSDMEPNRIRLVTHLDIQGKRHRSVRPGY